jgi:hypothetical protein
MEQPMNNESNELDYAKARLDAHSIPWVPISDECLRITVGERSYYYYLRRGRWRARGSNREYNTHSIDHLIKFLSGMGPYKGEG